MRSRKTEVGSWKLEVGSWKTEVEIRKLKFGRPKTESGIQNVP